MDRSALLFPPSTVILTSTVSSSAVKSYFFLDHHHPYLFREAMVDSGGRSLWHLTSLSCFGIASDMNLLMSVGWSEDFGRLRFVMSSLDILICECLL